VGGNGCFYLLDGIFLSFSKKKIKVLENNKTFSKHIPTLFVTRHTALTEAKE
jgi:hypothetical protein